MLNLRPYKRFSKFKSARQVGLKGLLAGAEGGGEALGLRASVGGSPHTACQAGGHLASRRRWEAAPVTGQVRAGHCQDGTSAQPRPSLTPDSSPATPSRPSHWTPLDASAVCGSLSWERALCGGVAAHPQSHPRPGQSLVAALPMERQ